MVKRLYHSSLFLFAFWSCFRFEIASAAALQHLALNKTEKQKRKPLFDSGAHRCFQMKPGSRGWDSLLAKRMFETLWRKRPVGLGEGAGGVEMPASF